jgi:hypothetical protein
MRQHHSFNLRVNDSSHRRTKSLSIERQRSFYIVDLDVDAWVHVISTVPSTRMKNKELEFCTYTQHDASSLAGCGKNPPAPQTVAREARDMREKRDVDRFGFPPRLARPTSLARLSCGGRSLLVSNVQAIDVLLCRNGFSAAG